MIQVRGQIRRFDLGPVGKALSSNGSAMTDIA